MSNKRINKQNYLDLNESINRMGQQNQEELQEAWWKPWTWNWAPWGPGYDEIPGMPGFYGVDGHGPPYYMYIDGDWVEVYDDGTPVPPRIPSYGDPTGKGLQDLDRYNKEHPLP
jgi:hypothetical protein